MNRRALAALILAFAAAHFHPAAAADLGAAPQPAPTPPIAPETGWQFRFAPYAWATSLNGNATVHGIKSNVNVSFIDILQKSDSVVALMGYAEARYDRWSIFGDANWSRVTASGAKVGQRNLPSGVNVSAGVNASITFNSFIGEAALGYEVIRWPWSSTSATSVDALGGLRYWNQSADLKLDLAAAASFAPLGFNVFGTRAVGKSGTLEWTDPIVGFRIRHSLTPVDDLQLRGDVGGFGVGSKFTWEAFAGYSHRFMWGSQPVDAFLGYRALSVDYSQGSGFTKAGINMVIHGPIFGAVFDF
jgi:hypothetical protein